jgi:hypothetical protein
MKRSRNSFLTPTLAARLSVAAQHEELVCPFLDVVVMTPGSLNREINCLSLVCRN